MSDNEKIALVRTRLGEVVANFSDEEILQIDRHWQLLKSAGFAD